jgi:Tfp pilus assembly protein PilO
MILVPIATFALYWLLLMNPALDRRAEIQKPLQDATAERDRAVAEADRMTQAKENYERDYDQLVELSKAIPQSVAVSDLMRELNRAAEGMGIGFSNITMAAPAATDVAAEATAATTTGAPVVEGLDEIPVELTFDGRFFALSDLFRSVQQFVEVADGRLDVHGRLIRVDKFSFDSGSFPNITAQISATVYAAPANEGITGGATPAGPAGAPRGDGGLQPVENFSPATASTVTP